MTKLPSYSLLRVICFQILAVTTATSCRPGEKGKWVFHGSDGFQIEQKCRLCTPSVPWLSHIPTNATGTLQLMLASGQMIGEYQMSNGVKHGHSRFWNATGQPIMDACYLHGKLNGLYTTWHDNGIKASEGMFDEDREVGRHREWYETGVIKTDGEYGNGLRNGRYRRWMADGEILADGIYSNMWAQSGTMVLERVEGKPPVIGVYSNGALIEKRQWQKTQ